MCIYVNFDEYDVLIKKFNRPPIRICTKKEIDWSKRLKEILCILQLNVQADLLLEGEHNITTCFGLHSFNTLERVCF